MRLTLLLLTLAAAGCSERIAAENGSAPTEPDAAPASVISPARPSAPDVRVEADPAPPFTYWAPSGAVIRNHPTNPGVWLAESDGRRTGAYYFGDQCRASVQQGLVGRPVRSLPDPPPPDWRISCETCPVTEDMRPDRLNIVFDSREIVTRVFCG